MMLKTIKLDRFLGLVNTTDPLKAPQGSFAVAENVDIDDQQAVHRRNGFTQVLSLTDLYATYNTESQDRLYIIDNGELREVYEDYTTSTLATGFPKGQYYFEEVGYKLYISGPKKVVLLNGEVREWQIPTAPTPDIEVGPGTLHAGRYLVSAVYINEWGEEGGASIPAVVEVSEGSSLSINPTYKSGHLVALYLSSVNSETQYLLSQTDSGTVVADGELIDLVDPMPEEQAQRYPIPDEVAQIAYYDGRMYGAAYYPDRGTSYIYYSEPFWLNLYNLFGDYIPVQGEIRMLEHFNGGIVIGTESTVHVYSSEYGLQQITDYGVPRGYSATRSPEGVLYFWTNRGMCRLPDFANMTEKAVSVDPGTSCFTAYVQQDGYNKLLVSTSSGGVVNNRYAPGGQ